MMDHLALLASLQQQTVALETAVAHQEWDAAQAIMSERLALLQQLVASPAEDLHIRQQIAAAAAVLVGQEQQIVDVLTLEQQAVESALLNLLAGGRARQVYQQHR